MAPSNAVQFAKLELVRADSSLDQGRNYQSYHAHQLQQDVE